MENAVPPFKAHGITASGVWQQADIYMEKSGKAEINGLISRLAKYNQPVMAFTHQKADKVEIIVCTPYTLWDGRGLLERWKFQALI